MKKIQVYHFHNGTGGGVLSVIKNLLRFSKDSDIENHIIHAINKVIVPDYNIEHIEGAVSQQLFYYKAEDNFYHTCKSLAKLLPGDKAIIVAHDWLELGMTSNLGLQNPVVQIVHGNYDYYYELAKRHDHAVDAYICVSPRIANTLKERLPARKENIFQCNFPVPPVEPKTQANKSLRLIYYVRDLNDENKNFPTVVEIARQLAGNANDYFFTIAAAGMTQEEFFEAWPVSMKDKVAYLGFRTNEEILRILPQQDIFLLPSTSEGLPVSLVEAMKAGVVPMITNWDGAVEDLVISSVTGYYFNIAAATDYGNCIKTLQNDRALLQQLSNNCKEVANKLFDPQKNVQRYEDVYRAVVTKDRVKKKAEKIYGSRLDNPLIPNFLTNRIRTRK